MPKKILLVEDEALIAMNEAQTLKKHGYEVVTAYNAKKSIEAVDSDPEISLILMDIDLGKGMDGTEAAEQILNKKDIPVVFLSSHTEPEIVERTENITSYGYVVKNSGDTVLLASIKMAFRLFDARMKEKEHKEALLHSYSFMSYIIEHNQSAVAVHDRDLKYIYVSKQYLNQYNVEQRDIIGKHHYEVFPDLPQKWKEVHKRALKGEVSRGEDDPYEHDDGTIEWTRWECRPWYEADGTIGGFIIYTEVISKERQTKFDLRDSTNYLQSILRTIRDGFWVLDTDGNFIDVNRAYCEMTGYTRNDFFQMNVSDIDVDYRPQNTSDRLKRIISTGSEIFHARHRRKDGSIFDVEVSASFLGGNQDKFICFCRDITERRQAEDALKESEENLRITLNSIGDAVISTDIGGNIKRMNPVAENLCGWSSSEAKGKSLTKVFRIVNAYTGKTVEDPVAKVLETGNIIGLANHTMLISKDGTEYQIADSAAPIRDENDHTTGVVLVFRDVTEEYQKEKQLQERVKELRSIEWMLSNKTTKQEEYLPGYGDLSNLNKDGLILYSVGKEQLKDIASEYLDLLETSTAIYEKDGSYALGIFTSGWCRLMDSASRKLCNTEDNRGALESGKWLCHESCWNVSALAMSEDRPVEVKCNGGIRMYAVPVHAGGETVGSINFGYGSPPTDDKELETLSKDFKIPIDELRRKAEAYNPRPQFIIDYAKERIHTAATQLGRILRLKRNEQELREGNKTAHQFFSESAAGAFFMMLDEPIEWNDSVDKEKVLDYVFSHQRITQINTAMLDQYLAREEEFLGKTPNQLFAHDVEHGRSLWSKMFDQGFLSIDSNERRFDGSQLWIVGSYRCMYDELGRITGHFGTQHDITELKRAEEKIQEALAEKDFLMKELNHRVKNNLNMVSSLINLKDSETEADLSGIKHQIAAIGLIHEKLFQTGNVTEIGFQDYISDLLNSIFSSFSRRPVKIESNIDEISIPTKSAMSLGLIVNEIATNAIKHGFDETEEAVFSVNMKEDRGNNRYELILSNTGNPFPEDVDVINPQTLGLRLISTLTEQLGGTIALQRKPYPLFTIRFPIGDVSPI